MAYLPEPYYYFVSSLPALYLGKTPPLSSDEFLRTAVGIMSPAVLYELQQIEAVPRETYCCELEQHWVAFDTYIRDCLGHYRGAHLKKDFREWQRRQGDAFPSIKPKLDEVYNMTDPVQQEWTLDTLRWWFLDHLTAMKPYAFDAVVAYRIKLLMTEKWAAVSEEAGKQHLQELIGDVWQEAEQTREEVRQEA